MAFQFKLPDIGEGIQEGEIVRWIKDEGEVVHEDEPLVEVMTDKATVELTSPRTGTVGKLNFKEGDMAQVGQVICEIEENGMADKAAKPSKTAKAGMADKAGKASKAGKESGKASKADMTSKSSSADAKAAAGGGPSEASAPQEDGDRSPFRASPEKEEEKTLFDLPKEMAATTKRIARKAASQQVPSQSQVPKGYKATAAPAVRRFARENDVDIDQVLGTGQEGRVTRDDIQRWMSGAQTAAAPAGHGARFDYSGVVYSSDAEREERVPLRGLRRTIAKAMERSKFTATHFTYVAEVDCDELVALREKAKGVAEGQGVSLSYLPFITKAAVAALKRHPDVNVAFDETSSEIVRKSYFHIGIATATDAGLIVPVVRDADRKGILQIAQEVADLSSRTRAGKAKPEELSGSTFTITSLGRLGGVMATPILNYPEVAIMGIHEMKQVPVVKDGALAIGWRMNLSFSFDHRIVDGYNGALFANTLIRFLEDPQLLMLEAL